VLGRHLRADPSSAAAVHCIWPLAGHCGACLLEAVGGTLRYLDMEPCLGAGWAALSEQGDARVWGCLAAALRRASGEAVAELDSAGARLGGGRRGRRAPRGGGGRLGAGEGAWGEKGARGGERAPGGGEGAWGGPCCLALGAPPVGQHKTRVDLGILACLQVMRRVAAGQQPPGGGSRPPLRWMPGGSCTSCCRTAPAGGRAGTWGRRTWQRWGRPCQRRP
jgi:hypothetical protein